MNDTNSKMKWENLATMTCPYCSEPIYEDWDEKVKCSGCRFTIEKQRMVAIKRNRAFPEKRNIVKMKWQNLKECQCPIDGYDLSRAVGKYEVLECTKSDCTFRIRDDRMQEILDDESHPANQFSYAKTITKS